MLDLDVDPKLAWALSQRGQFPLDVNRAEREALLRVPGFGTKTVQRILSARRAAKLRYADLIRLGAVMKKAAPFIVALDWKPGSLAQSERLRERFAPKPVQLGLFA
jgi:predicted DNA-binding helix-hairpin-helix protein